MDIESSTPKGYITTEEAAERLNIHRATVLKSLYNGRLKGHKIGEGARATWLVDEASLGDWKRSPAGKKEKS